jgi:hypothetical protein
VEKELEELKALLREYRLAAQKFIAKCETGRARSVETYADLRACEQAAIKLFGA